MAGIRGMKWREVRTKEKMTENDEKENIGYRQIKPETKMTTKEADNFWKKEFQNVRAE